MSVAPYKKDKPICYEFTACPIAEFAKQHDLLEVMPAMCNPDYTAMELLHARLVRTTTCADGCKCDYTICGDRGGFWQCFVILSVMNLIDRFLIDDLWVGHTKAWVIPGTEDLMPYISKADKQKKWLAGTVGMGVISAVIAGIGMLF